MKVVFADTLYWIAVVRPGDPWSDAAREARAKVAGATLATTDEVLGEFLAALSRGGKELRTRAAAMVESIMIHPDVDVVPQSRAGFLAALSLYRSRLDKAFSLVDCSSMVAMRSLGIDAVLTNDGHFRQEGFQTLIEPPQEVR
jgi:predicted nucleic acid-binding protein